MRSGMNGTQTLSGIQVTKKGAMDSWEVSPNQAVVQLTGTAEATLLVLAHYHWKSLLVAYAV